MQTLPALYTPICHFKPAVLREVHLTMHMNYPCFFASTINCLETRPFPNSSFTTSPIHFLFVDILWLVFHQRSRCAWLPWGRMDLLNSDLPFMLCPGWLSLNQRFLILMSSIGSIFFFFMTQFLTFCSPASQPL